jgi:hypothetical protein
MKGKKEVILEEEKGVEKTMYGKVFNFPTHLEKRNAQWKTSFQFSAPLRLRLPFSHNSHNNNATIFFNVTFLKSLEGTSSQNPRLKIVKLFVKQFKLCTEN